MRDSPRCETLVRSAAAVAAVVIAGTPNALAQPPSFSLIPPVSGTMTTGAYGLSAEGSAVAGFSIGGASGTTPGFVWRANTGRYDFGLEPGLPAGTFSRAISGDGSTVVGEAMSGLSSITRAFRWRAGAGGGPGTYQDLGLIGLYARSYATGVSGGGSVVVGHVQGESSSSTQAFRWTEAGGMQGLGFLPGTNTSRATAISRDGAVVAGWGFTPGGSPRAFTWTATAGLQPLAAPPETPATAAFATNADGRVIVGYSGISLRATIWRDGAPEVLGVAPGFVEGWALAVNDDGSIIGGRTSNSPNLVRAGIWTPSGGAQVLSDYLTANGVSIPAGWILEECTGVSADGLTFSGNARLPGESIQGFVAHVPGPGGVGVAVLVGVTAIGRRRRRGGRCD